MKFWQPFGVTDPDASYQNGNLELGIDGSVPPAEAIEHPMREIVAAIVAAGMTPSATDLTQLAQAIPLLVKPVVRPRLTSSLTFYVRTDGNDNNSGLLNTGAGAFLTIQAAFAKALTYDAAGFAITIQVANGTYSGAGLLASSPLIGSPNYINLVGNPASPNLCVIANTQSTGNTAAIGATQGGTLNVAGFTVQSAFGNAISAFGAGSIVQYSNMIFGACPNGSHVSAVLGGECIIAQGTTVYQITGSALSHFYSAQAGSIYNNNAASATGITLVATPSFPNGFAVATIASSQSLPNLSFSGSTPTGSRYQVGAVSVINTNGGGANYFPGSTAGATNGNGFYA